MNQPLVSVIIPNYNHAKYLDERIQSVLNQTYKNFEVIILDDVSKDNSREIIEKYRKNKHISHIVFNEINSGSTFKQWDKGLSLAKGDLIWIAESDDSCENMLLEKLVAEFQKDRQLVLAFCNSMIIDENGNRKTIIQNKKWRKDVRVSGAEFIHDYLYIDNIIYNASSAIFSKNAVTKIDRQYTNYKGSGDWLFWIELCQQGNIAMIKEPLNYFRKHFGNVTTKMESNGVQQLENKRIFDYLINNKLISNQSAASHKRRNIYQYKYCIHFQNDNIKANVIRAWEPSLADMIYAYLYRLYILNRHLCRIFIGRNNNK